MFISKPFNAPTKPAIGAWSAPPSWASSSSFVGRLASRFTCSGVTALPSTSPTLIAGLSNSLAKSASTFAAATGSAPASTRPVGPASERVLHHHELRPRLPQPPPQLRQLRDVEPGEVGDVHRGGAAQPAGQRRHQLLFLRLGPDHANTAGSRGTPGPIVLATVTDRM